MSKILIGTTIIMATWLCACAPLATPTQPPAPTATLRIPTATVLPQTSVAPSAIEIGDNDKGKAITASIGARIRVVLNSTYWQFDDSASPALKQLGAPVVTPDTTVRIPGTGAGTIAVEFQAIALGQANIRATRVTCGEALLCAEDQRVFQVMINIK